MSVTPSAPAGPETFATVREHAAWARRHGRLHPAALAATAGYRGLRTAAALGGAAAPGSAVVATAAALARADGAAAWVLGEHWTASWIAGLLPVDVARRVLGGGAVCGTLAPTGTLSGRPGGAAVLRGVWDAVCGAGGARWQMVVALGGAGREPGPVAVAVETSALRRAGGTVVPGPGRDGLRGADRARVVADGVPVPAEQVLRLVDVLRGRPGDALHGAPLVPVAALPVAGALVGLGRAALDAAHPAPPAAVVESLDRAAALAAALGADVDDRTGRPWTLAERAAARADLDAVVRLVQEAVAELAAADPGSGRVAEVLRDVRAVDRFGDAADRAPDRYSRALCGLHL